MTVRATDTRRGVQALDLADAIGGQDRPIDVGIAAKPEALVADLMARVASLEYDVLRLEALADGGPADQATRTRVLAARAARETDVLRRRVERLHVDMEVRQVVDRLVAGGEQFDRLMVEIINVVDAHDARAAHEIEQTALRDALRVLNAERDEGDDVEEVPLERGRGAVSGSHVSPKKRKPPVPNGGRAVPEKLTAEQKAEREAGYEEALASTRKALAATGGEMSVVRDPSFKGAVVDHLRSLIERQQEF